LLPKTPKPLQTLGLINQLAAVKMLLRKLNKFRNFSTLTTQKKANINDLASYGKDGITLDKNNLKDFRNLEED